MTATAGRMSGAELVRTRSATEAIGADARWIGEQLEKIARERVSETMSVGWSRREAMRTLMEILDECAEPGWDGDDARPVDLGSWARAARLIIDLPVEAPMPDVSIDPDGEISLEWRFGARRALSASVGAEGRLTYATIAGANRVFGTEYYGGGFPATILESLRRIIAA